MSSSNTTEVWSEHHCAVIATGLRKTYPRFENVGKEFLANLDELFSAEMISTFGARNLWTVLSHIARQNSSLKPDAEKFVQTWVDVWLGEDEENRARLLEAKSSACINTAVLEHTGGMYFLEEEPVVFHDALIARRMRLLGNSGLVCAAFGDTAAINSTLETFLALDQAATSPIAVDCSTNPSSSDDDVSTFLTLKEAATPPTAAVALPNPASSDDEKEQPQAPRFWFLGYVAIQISFLCLGVALGLAWSRLSA